MAMLNNQKVSSGNRTPSWKNYPPCVDDLPCLEEGTPPNLIRLGSGSFIFIWKNWHLDLRNWLIGSYTYVYIYNVYAYMYEYTYMHGELEVVISFCQSINKSNKVK
jgi:hypothetical protein